VAIGGAEELREPFAHGHLATRVEQNLRALVQLGHCELSVAKEDPIVDTVELRSEKVVLSKDAL